MPESHKPPCAMLVVMGVSACGKSSVGAAVAARLGWNYQEGDDFHPSANVEKMRAGIPLDDADRQPWLAAIAEWMDVQAASAQAGVVGCSALKRKYRDFLRNGRPRVWFVYLRVSRAELQRRVATRHHEYMPASLLDSQLETLQEPVADEPQTLTIDADGDVNANAAAVLRALRAQGIVDVPTSG
ncbi:MAG: gluconokinase [Rhodanobacteraceae bacterium]